MKYHQYSTVYSEETKKVLNSVTITPQSKDWEDSDLWRERIYIDGKEVTKIEVTTTKDRELQQKIADYLLQQSRIAIDKTFLK